MRNHSRREVELDGRQSQRIENVTVGDETDSLLVSGGTIVQSAGRTVGDLLLLNGRIAAVGHAGTLGSAATVLDASGLYVMPGLVDAHVHVREPGLTHKEDFGSASRAAAAGGVTTFLVMPFDDPPASNGPTLANNARYGNSVSFVDYGMLGTVGPRDVDRIPDLARAGALSIEVMLADAPALIGCPTSAEFRRIQTAAREYGIPVGVYCDDPLISAAAREAVLTVGRRDASAFLESKPAIAEAVGAGLACELALETGATIHLRQLSTSRAVEIAVTAKGLGADVSTEVTPHYLSLTSLDAAANGPGLKVVPPLRTKSEAAALRDAVRRGDVDIVATDHAPHAPAEKAAGDDDIWAAPGGFPGLETMLPVMFELFGDDAPEIVARVCAEAPASRFGLSHRKGSIRVGKDADLVLFDPHGSWTVAVDQLHTRAHASPYAGRSFRGSVRYTILRGGLVSKDRDIVAGARGRWLTRATTDESGVGVSGDQLA